METKRKKILVISLLATVMFLNGFVFVKAQNTDYTVLAPLPGTTENPNCTGTNCQATLFGSNGYLQGIFNLMIGVGAVAAFVIITIYGFEYMLTDSLIKKQNSKKWLEDALWGLGLIIFAYAILNTLSPRFVSCTFTLPTPTISAPQTVATTVGGGACTNCSAGNIAGVPMTQAQIDQSNAVRAGLAASPNNVLTYAGPCTGTTYTGCVDLNGIQTPTWDGLVALEKLCTSQCVDITGGTEPGHTTDSCHNNGTCVDIQSNSTVNAAITSQPLTPCQTYTAPSGGSYLWEPKGSTCGGTVPSSNDHWHASFP